jgi:hypothetical protein
MPYIKKDDRNVLTNKVHKVSTQIETVGELNYCISLLIHDFIKTVGLKYAVINSAIGVLECAKLELYRMIAGPYEDKKRLENGSVSELDAPTLEDVR